MLEQNAGQRAGRAAAAPGAFNGHLVAVVKPAGRGFTSGGTSRAPGSSGDTWVAQTPRRGSPGSLGGAACICSSRFERGVF